MKNTILKICSIFILFALFILPFSAFGAKNQVPVESTAIVQESTTVVEETTTAFKMITTFEDKLEMIRVRSDKVPEETTTAPVIEEKTTRQAKTQTPSTTKTTTAPTTTKPAETTTEPVEEDTEAATDSLEESTTLVSPVYSGKYDAAVQVWNYLHAIGCNDYASAGILGNMMSECGGHTLELQWWIYDNGYYGLCQWYYKYFPSVQGADLTSQIEFLGSTLPSTMNSYGYMYASGFNYNSFANIDDISAAAIAFAKCYERCASWTYNSRVNNAYKAYHYFCP